MWTGGSICTRPLSIDYSSILVFYKSKLLRGGMGGVFFRSGTGVSWTSPPPPGLRVGWNRLRPALCSRRSYDYRMVSFNRPRLKCMSVIHNLYEWRYSCILQHLLDLQHNAWKRGVSPLWIAPSPRRSVPRRHMACFWKQPSGHHRERFKCPPHANDNPPQWTGRKGTKWLSDNQMFSEGETKAEVVMCFIVQVIWDFSHEHASSTFKSNDILTLL